jgi:hypothetical protein
VITSEDIKRLVDFRGPDESVLSLYVALPADPGELRGAHAHFESLLKPVNDVIASRQLPHAARESLAADVARILKPFDITLEDKQVVQEALAQLEARVRSLQGRSLAIFACHQAGSGRGGRANQSRRAGTFPSAGMTTGLRNCPAATTGIRPPWSMSSCKRGTPIC